MRRAEIYRNLGEHFGIPGEFIFLKKLEESNLEEEFDDRAVNFANMLHSMDKHE